MANHLNSSGPELFERNGQLYDVDDVHNEESSLIGSMEITREETNEDSDDVPLLFSWQDMCDWRNILAIIISVTLGTFLNSKITESWVVEYRPCIGCGAAHKCNVIHDAVPDGVLRLRYAAFPEDALEDIDKETLRWSSGIIEQLADGTPIESPGSDESTCWNSRIGSTFMLEQNQTGSVDSPLGTQHSLEFSSEQVFTLPKLHFTDRQLELGSISVSRKGFKPETRERLQELISSIGNGIAESGLRPSAESESLKLLAFKEVVVNPDGWIFSCGSCKGLAPSRCSSWDPLDIKSVCRNFDEYRYVDKAISLALPRVDHDPRLLAFRLVPSLARLLGMRLLEADPKFRIHLGHRTRGMEDWVRLLGIDRNRVLWGGNVRVRTLLVPKLDQECLLPPPSYLRLSHHFVSQGLASTRFNRCLKDPATGETLNNLVILLAEKGGALSNRDNIVLEQKLVKHLEGKRYTFVTISDYDPVPIEVMLGLFSRAVAVIGPAGYMFGHTISAPPGTCVFQFLPEDLSLESDAGVTTWQYPSSIHSSLVLGMRYEAIPMVPVVSPLDSLPMPGQIQRQLYQVDMDYLVKELFECLLPSEPQI